MTIDWSAIISALGIVGFVYAFLRNFKSDMNSRFSRMENRMDLFEKKIVSMEERMFWMATGKSLSDAIKEERMKVEKCE